MGAGYDLNIDAAPVLADAQDAPSWNTGASVSGSVLWDRTRASLQLSWDLVDLPTLPGLRSHSLQARPALRFPVAWHLDATVGPAVGLRLVNEEARSAWEAGAGGALDWQARPWLRTDLGYRFLHHDAQDPVYDSDSHRLGVGAEATIASRTRLRLDLTADLGQVVLYEEISTTTDGATDGGTDGATDGGSDGGSDGARQARSDGATAGTGTADRPSTSTTAFGSDALAWSTQAFTTGLVLGLRQGLGTHVDLGLALGLVEGRYDQGSWLAPYGHLGLALYLP